MFNDYGEDISHCETPDRAVKLLGNIAARWHLVAPIDREMINGLLSDIEQTSAVSASNEGTHDLSSRFADGNGYFMDAFG